MKTLNDKVYKLLHQGTVIPAHPLALTANRTLDEEAQRRLTRYYLAAGAGGLAVGVHTTQFAIRDPEINLYRKVLELAMDEVKKSGKNDEIIKVAGVSGPTDQAAKEARLAHDLGYDLALVSTNGLGHWSEEDLLKRAREISMEIPLFGFYLQPAVGGRVLSQNFWEGFADIPNVYAIKMAPFNRYQTLDVVHAVCRSGRNEEIALYTGNDDTIISDLLTTYAIRTNQGMIKKDIVGGLLGHWAVWTKSAVEQLNNIKAIKEKGSAVPQDMLTLAAQVTDSNAAFFDARNAFEGCIAGIHEVLFRQGLLKGIWCLDEAEKLSPGQSDEITRVYEDYPHLSDDTFVKRFLREDRA